MKKKKKGLSDDEFMAAVAARFKSLRKKKTDLSAESFALEIDIARAQYLKYEQGKTNITLKNLNKIINGLGVSPDEFFAEGF